MEDGMKENNVTISEEVMVTIANIATKEVEGVAGLHTGMVDSIIDKFTGTNWSGGVSVVIEEDKILVSLIINVIYNHNILDVAKKVQENVKNAIETMTEMQVAEVNVHVHGLVVVSEKAEK